MTCDVANDDVLDVQAGGRCRIVKCLQHEVEKMSNERADIDHFSSRAAIAENALKVMEAEFKLKVDDFEDTIERLRIENDKLRKRIMQAEHNQDDSDSLITEKYRKWKHKFQILRESAPNCENAAKVVQLESRTAILEEQIQKLTCEKDAETNKNKQLLGQLAQSENEQRRLRTTNADLSMKVKRLQEENAELKEENKKLNDENKKRETLLSHVRKKQEKVIMSKKDAEENAKRNLELQKRATAEQQREVTKANERADKEAEEKKQMQKKMTKLQRKCDSKVVQLQAKVAEHETREKLLSKELEDCRKQKLELETNLSELRQANQNLETTSHEATKIERQNQVLQEKVCEQQAKIETLKEQLKSLTNDQERKLIDLQMTMKTSTDWNGMIQAVRTLVTDHESSLAENMQQKEAMKTLKNDLSKTKRQIETYKSQARKFKAKMESKLQKCEAELESIKNKSGDDITMFRNTIRRKMDNHHRHNNQRIAEAVSLLKGEEHANDTEFRDVCLTVLLIIRWKHYKHTCAFDPGVIVEYANKTHQRQSQSKELIVLVQKMIDDVHKLEEEVEDAKNREKSKKHRIEELESELRQAQENVTKQMHANTRLSCDLESVRCKVEEMVSSDKYSTLQARFDKKADECKSIQQQMKRLKEEMGKLLETNQDISELQGRIETLSDENKSLSEKLESIRREHEVTESALREKTREILALERKVERQRTPVVMMNHTPIQDEESEDFCLSQSLKNGLAEMQTRMMRQARIV